MTNNLGIGPLYLAILNDREDCSEFLIEGGALFYYEEIEFRDLSPIYLAIRK